MKEVLLPSLIALFMVFSSPLIIHAEDYIAPNVGYPKVNAPKYYAVKVVPAVLGTMSGIKTDLDAQVLDASGKPIEGLFAAGELANGDFFNRVYPASGTSIQMSVTFGRVAGINAAELAK